MLLSLIAAMAKDRVIGKDNAMPWHLPADLRHFKAVTLGKPVVMGRRTFESIGRPLPGRRNVVVSRNAQWRVEGVEVAASLEAALELLADCDEVMIIGGGQLYTEALPRADRLYLTYIDAQLSGDTHFPDYMPLGWQELERARHPADEKNAYACEFVTLSRQR
jgi:dihydrofolate reductase